MFEHLDTVAQVEAHVANAYASLRRGATRLPLEVANASALMEHAVVLSGERGLARQELLKVFGPLGKERFASAVDGMEAACGVVKRTERRPNAAGRQQAQTVYYAPSKTPAE